jgi:hypothetical protein
MRAFYRRGGFETRPYITGKMPVPLKNLNWFWRLF